MWPSSLFPNMNAVPPNRWGARVISPQELTAAVIRFLALRTDITVGFAVDGWQLSVCRSGGGLFRGLVRVGRGGEDGTRLRPAHGATRSMRPKGLMGLFGHSDYFFA